MFKDNDTEVGGTNLYAIRLGDSIKNLRKLKGYSQKEFAEKLGRHFNTVSSWEAGTSSPDGPDIYKLVRVLGVSLQRLFYGDAAVSTSTLPESSTVDAELYLKILRWLERRIDQLRPELPAAKRLDLAAYAYRMAQSTGRGFNEPDLEDLLRLST